MTVGTAGALTWNEETLRTHVLMPFLDALKLSPTSIHVEWKFSVRLGRTNNAIDGTPIEGRADALIRNAEGENLFVVELKSPDNKLTERDRDQGISYARLLDQIAPFVVVSNGKQTQIFDTITKQQLDRKTFHTESQFFKSGALVSGDDIRIRFEALAHFIAHSEENVSAFSKAQIEVSIRALRERVDGPGKYVPELYVPRETVRSALKEFLAHDAQVFALVGESGVGKTNELCALAEHFASTHIVLFFACYSLNQPPELALADEFNWSFSQRLDAPKLCKQLSQMSERVKKPVLIFFDALDEAPVAGFPVAMSNFAKHLAQFAPSIRLIVSSKRSEWSRFASLRGNPSALALGMTSIHAKQPLNLLDWKPGEPVTLNQFSESEGTAAIERYQKKFDLVAVSQSNVQVLLRHPFFLRVYSETYRCKKAIARAITSDELVSNWLTKKFASFEEPQKLLLGAKHVAEAVYRKNLTDNDDSPRTLGSLECIEIDQLNESELDELITHDILVKTLDHHGRGTVRFYYSEVLYYLISRHVLRLDTLEQSAFGAHVPILLENYVLQGVLQSHLRTACASHQIELENQISGRALVFLTTYSGIFTRLAPALRPAVIPYGEGEIGFAYVAETSGMMFFGFYNVSPEIPQCIRRIDAQSGLDGVSAALANLGCHGIQCGGYNFSNSPPRLAAAKMALKQINDAIERGRLDEQDAQTILVEALLSIVGDSDTRRKLRLGYGSSWLGHRRALVPVDLTELKIRAQKCVGVDGADLAIRCYDKDLSHLLWLIEHLLSQGITTIQSDVLPAPDLSSPDLNAPLEAYSDKQLELLIRTFFDEGFSGFVRVVEANFGKLSALFPTFSGRTFRVIAGLTRETRPNPHNGWGLLLWAWGHSNDAVNEVRVVLNPSESFFSRGPDSSLRLDGFKVKSVHSTDIQTLFRHTASVGISMRDKHRHLHNVPIRSFAYSLLRNDWKNVSAENLLELLDKCDQDTERENP